MTSIEAQCRRCGRVFTLFQIRVERSGRCPGCGSMLTPDRTEELLQHGANADVALRHLVEALRAVRGLPGVVVLRPHTVMRNLFEEVGWEEDLAGDTESLYEELHELRSLVAAWEALDPARWQPTPHRVRPILIAINASTQGPRAWPASATAIRGDARSAQAREASVRAPSG